MNGNLQKLNKKEQVELCAKIGEYYTYRETSTWLKESYGKRISEVAFHYYKKHPKWKPVIQKFRDDYNQAIYDVPLTSKRKRLEELQTIYEKAKNKRKLETQQSIIRDCRDEVEETGVSGGNFYFTQINNEFASMTDEELSELKLKEIDRLKKLKQIIGGKHEKVEIERYASQVH